MVFSIKGVWAGVVTLRWTENPFNLVRFREIPQSVNSNLLWRNWLAQESYTFKVVGSSPTSKTIWECGNDGELRQTVNLLPYGLGGSNPSTPTILMNLL